MDQYILDFCKPIINNKIDEGYYNHMISRIEEISKKDIKNFMNKVSNQKNKKDDVRDTLTVCSNYMNSNNISDKEKLIIFYYAYRYNKIVLNNDLINLKQKKIIKDLKFKKPNSYTGYLNDEEYSVKIILDEDIILKKIYQNYKILQIYNIPVPEINLNFTLDEYKTILVEKNSKITENDDKLQIFLDILNILRCFSKNKLFVNFDYWNIRNVSGRYYLVNLLNITKQTQINIKNQINILKEILGIFKKTSFHSYHDTFKYIIEKRNTKIDF